MITRLVLTSAAVLGLASTTMAGTSLVNWPDSIVFGAGKLAALGEEAMALGWRRALVLTTTGRSRKEENAT
jgi:hypothetical protein